MPWVGLQFVTVVFPDYTQYLYLLCNTNSQCKQGQPMEQTNGLCFTCNFGVAVKPVLAPSKILYGPFQGGTSFVDLLCFFLSCVCYVFVRVCLCVLCGRLLGKD